MTLSIAGWLVVLYLVPALLLFVLLVACFSAGVICPAALYSIFPLSPVLRALEWPWGEIEPAGMFAGPWLGKMFVLAVIVLNAAIVYLAFAAITRLATR